MSFDPSLPNTKRGESSHDGRGRLRRKRAMANRIRRVMRKNPARGAALAKRFRAQLARTPGGGGEDALLPRDVSPSGRRRPGSDRVFRRQDAMASLRADRRAGFGATL